MRRPNACLLVAAALLVPTIASAQTGTSTTMAVGSCTSGVTATIGFAARTDTQSSSSQPTPISQTFAPYAFGRAECDCDPSETSGDAVYMLLQVSMGFSQGTQATPTAWVGEGCDTYTTRINQSAVSCRQFMPTNLTATSFTAGSGNIGISTFYFLWVPARELFSPETGLCDTNGANNIYIFLGNDQTNPDATCEVDLAEQAIPPTPAISPSAQSGDSAITVSWQGPALTNLGDAGAANGLILPAYYQVLCADQSGNPIKSNPQQPAYSTCQADGIHRRQNIFSPTNISGGGDGGVVDAGVVEDLLGFAGHVPAPGASPAVTDGGVDGGTDLGSSTDMAANPLDTAPRVTSFPGMNLGPFATLDPKFICSTFIDATTTTSFSERIGGLTNNESYQFVVVAIDQYGNPSPSPLLIGVPKPVEDLYGALRADGLDAHGFCFVATAAFGDYDHPMVRILRAFRDRVLQPEAIGRAFVRAYYASSPPLAHFIAAGNARRFVARMLLWPLVGFAELALFLHSFWLALLVVAVPVVLLYRRRRRRTRLSEATA